MLEDDLAYFPRYEALFLYNFASLARYPGAVEQLARLGGKITEKEMAGMN